MLGLSKYVKIVGIEDAAGWVKIKYLARVGKEGYNIPSETIYPKTALTKEVNQLSPGDIVEVERAADGSSISQIITMGGKKVFS
ncbi:MAG: hypothetical protein HZB67_06205 [Candidatus Aenigmarchaeota archaeon]|nr:hypothetical protein [Candidatus Aenigmarchaeota archaeon]